MLLQISRFRSALPDDEVIRTFEKRSAQFRSVKGLRQKYYIRYPDTGEFGAVYVWDSQADMQAFRASPFAATMPEAYRLEGPAERQVTEVVMVLRPGQA